MKQLQPLKEYYELKLSPQQLTEATSREGQPMILKKVLLQRANAKNRNGRIYPRAILEREMNKYNETMVEANRALGELDHDQSNVVNLKNVSHIIRASYWEGDDVYGDIEILDGPEFPAGRIAAGLLRRRIPVGISSRGMGTVETIDENTVEVTDDFALLCFDLVSFESTQDATLKLLEGRDHSIINISMHHYDKIDQIIHDLICENSGVCSCMFGDKKKTA